MSKKNDFELYDDRVLVEPQPAQNKTAGGIIIPDTAQEKPQRGIVRGVGPGKYENGQVRPVPQRVGDAILYGKYSGSEVSVSGKDYLVMRSSDIIMKDPEVK